MKARPWLFAGTVVLLAVPAAAGEVYCFAQKQDGTTYLTPVFASDADPYLLQSVFSASLTDVGLSVCVTNEDEPDINAAWKDFFEGLENDELPVELREPPAPG